MGMPRHAKYKECLLKAQELFFPSLNSQYGKYSGMTLPQLYLHEEPRKVPFLIILSDGCYTQFPVRILPPTSCMLAGVGLAVIGSDLHRGDETMLNFATVC